MTDVLLYIIWRRSETLRARYPRGFPRPWCADNVAMEDAVFHCNFYLSWGFLIVTLTAVASLFSAWALLALVGLLVLALHALYREAVTDGHWKRIRDHAETPEQLLDFKSDLITRLVGLMVPTAMALLLIAARLCVR